MSYSSFPSLLPDSCNMKLISKSQLFESELSGHTQTASLPGDYWTATLTFNEIYHREAAILRAFLAGIGGRSGRFWLPIPGYKSSGTAQGAGVVSTAGQTGKNIVTSGWSPNQALLFDYADYIQVGDYLHMITSPVSSDSLGASVLTVAPALRISPGASVSIVTVAPACLMMLSDDNQASWDIFNSILYNMSISCREPLDI